MLWKKGINASIKQPDGTYKQKNKNELIIDLENLKNTVK